MPSPPALRSRNIPRIRFQARDRVLAKTVNARVSRTSTPRLSVWVGNVTSLRAFEKLDQDSRGPLTKVHCPFRGMAVKRRADGTYIAMVSASRSLPDRDSYFRHELAHVRQLVMYDRWQSRLGLELKSRLPLRLFEDFLFRGRGKGAPVGIDPDLRDLTREKFLANRAAYEDILYRSPSRLAFGIARIFGSEKELFSAVFRMYRDPKMQTVIRSINREDVYRKELFERIGEYLIDYALKKNK